MSASASASTLQQWPVLSRKLRPASLDFRGRQGVFDLELGADAHEYVEALLI